MKRKNTDKRELTIGGIKRGHKNSFLRLTKTPRINITGKWLIIKGFRAGEKIIMDARFEKITLIPKKNIEEPPRWE